MGCADLLARSRHRCAEYPESIPAPLDVPDPPLRGSTFLLRPFQLSDFDAAVAFAADPDTARWVPPLPAGEPADVVTLFDQYRADGDMLHLVIADLTDDSYLGEVMLVMTDHHVGEVGCGVIASQRGHGVGPDALGMFIRWCLQHLGLGRVQALVAEENQPGLDLAARVGLRPEGVLRSYWGDGDHRIDVVMHSILPADLDEDRPNS